MINMIRVFDELITIDGIRKINLDYRGGNPKIPHGSVVFYWDDNETLWWKPTNNAHGVRKALSDPSITSMLGLNVIEVEVEVEVEVEELE